MGKPRVLSSSKLVEMSTALPEVVLKEGDNWTNITFKGKGFAWINHPENRAMIKAHYEEREALLAACLLYTSPSPRDYAASRMPSSA